MKQYKIKDNSFVKKENFSDIMGVVKAVADKTLEQLDREGIFVFPEMIDDVEDMAKKQMLLQSINDSFLSGNVMGFIGVGDERLVIESRFSTGNNDFLFQYLLLSYELTGFEPLFLHHIYYHALSLSDFQV